MMAKVANYRCKTKILAVFFKVSGVIADFSLTLTIIHKVL